MRRRNINSTHSSVCCNKKTVMIRITITDAFLTYITCAPAALSEAGIVYLLSVCLSVCLSVGPKTEKLLATN